MKTRITGPSENLATFTDLPLHRLSEETAASLAAYRQALLEALTEIECGDLPAHLVSQALNEAEALATLTPFPALFLPALADEKITAVRHWHERQQRLRDQEFTLAA